MQVRAGTGGDEAALFAGDVLRMYEKAAALCGWRFEVSTLIYLEVSMDPLSPVMSNGPCGLYCCI